MPWKNKSFAARMKTLRTEPDQAQREYDADRPSPSLRGYGRNWQRLRVMVLRRWPTCNSCGQPATEVHHVKPLADGGTNEWSNLMALCKPCHSRITAGGTGGP